MALIKPKLNISGKAESLKDFVNRYERLSDPRFIRKAMQAFTYKEDVKLYDKVTRDPRHPRDTGTLQKSWVHPSKYLQKYNSTHYSVYLINTATVGEQSKMYSSINGVIHRKKKRIGRHNLKRYMPWVDKRTKFYTNKLRVIKNSLDRDFKRFISEEFIPGLIIRENAINAGSRYI